MSSFSEASCDLQRWEPELQSAWTPADHISNKSVRKDQRSVKSMLCRFLWFCPQITFSMCRLMPGRGSFWWMWQMKKVERSVDLWRKSGNSGTRRAGRDTADEDTSQYLRYRPISHFQAQICSRFQVIGCRQVFTWKLKIHPSYVCQTFLPHEKSVRDLIWCCWW